MCQITDPAGGPPPDLAPKYSSDSFQIRAKPTWYFPSPFDKDEEQEERKRKAQEEEAVDGGQFDYTSRWESLLPREPAYTSVASAAAAASAGARRTNGSGGAKRYSYHSSMTKGAKTVDAFIFSMYYTDTNYPDHFWESAPSLKDMIKS